MKKRKLLFIVLLIVICSIPKNVYGLEYAIDDYDIDAVVLSNGDMKIEEKITYSFSEHANGLFRDVMYKYNSKKDSYEPESKRYMANDVEFKKVSYSDYSFYSLKDAILFDERDLKYGDKGKYSLIKKDNILRSKLYLPSISGDRKYVKYEIYLKDVVCNYNDAAEIYWNFIGNNFDCDINNLDIDLKIENGNQILKLYPHTYGNIDNRYNLNNLASININHLDANTPVDIRAVFDNFGFNTSKMFYEDYDFDKVSKIEDKMQKGKENLAKYNKNKIIILIVTICWSIIALIIAIVKRNRKTALYKDVEYNNELPDDLELGEYGNILLNCTYDSSSVLNATLLDLVNKKYIIFNPRKELVNNKEEYKYYMSLNSKMYDKHDKLSEYEKLLINYIFNKNVTYDKIENNDEIEINERFKEISKDSKLIGKFIHEAKMIDTKKNKDKHFYDMKDIYKILVPETIIMPIIASLNLFILYPKNDMPNMLFLTIVILFFIIGFTYLFVDIIRYKVSDKYVDTFNKLMGLKKYLNDYSLLKDRMPIELVLWEKYMVFATLFGISKKVLKEFKEELINQGYDSDYIASYPSYAISDCFVNSTAFNDYSNSSAGFSGSGSGGGGGRWRRWRCFLNIMINRIKINLIYFFKIVFVIFLFILTFQSSFGKSEFYNRYKAKVVEDIDTYFENDIKIQKVKIKIISECIYKDNEYESEYVLKGFDTAEVRKLKKGDIIFVYLSDKEDMTFNIEDLNRIPYVIFIVLLFVLVLLIVGRRQGLKTIVSLFVTFFTIFYILIPMIINGHSAILSSLVVCIIISIVSFLIIAGFSKKSFVAMLGTIFGVIVACILAVIVSKLGDISGLVNSEAQMLVYISKEIKIDINGLLFASIIISTIGATMDIAMSIASTMSEIDGKVKNISIKELIKAGMNVGRDAMATMSNTLILAYVGESLILIIIFMINTTDITYILNSDLICTEILKGLCSTIGMILTIPLTTWFYGVVKKISLNIKKEKML